MTVQRRNMAMLLNMKRSLQSDNLIIFHANDLGGQIQVIDMIIQNLSQASG